MDVINFISKAPGLPDARSTKARLSPVGHRTFTRLGRGSTSSSMVWVRLWEEYNAFTVGEMPGCDEHELIKAVGADRGELQMGFQFEM